MGDVQYAMSPQPSAAMGAAADAVAARRDNPEAMADGAIRRAGSAACQGSVRCPAPKIVCLHLQAKFNLPVSRTVAYRTGQPGRPHGLLPPPKLAPTKVAYLGHLFTCCADTRLLPLSV